MAAEYAGLETRVSELELQVRHMLPVRIDAVGYGLSLVRADTLQIRATQDIHTAALERLEARLGEQDTSLEGFGTRLEGLETKLERQDTRLEGIDARLDRQDTRLEGLETKLERQDTRLEGLETRLGQHGELLTEILRRLPEPPAG
jgi:chromosome segregation ATPase